MFEKTTDKLFKSYKRTFLHDISIYKFQIMEFEAFEASKLLNLWGFILKNWQKKRKGDIWWLTDATAASTEYWITDTFQKLFLVNIFYKSMLVSIILHYAFHPKVCPSSKMLTNRHLLSADGARLRSRWHSCKLWLPASEVLNRNLSNYFQCELD